MSYTDQQIEKMLRDPMQAHRVQDKIASLTGSSLWVGTLVRNVYLNFQMVIDEIRSQAKDNRPLVEKMIGSDLLLEIESL